MKRQSFITGSAAALAAAPWLAAAARADTTLRAAAAAKGILFGSNFPGVFLVQRDSDFEKLVLRQCSIVEDGHDLQWRNLRPNPTSYNWGPADAFINWAHGKNEKIHECHLMWHRGTAPWMASYINAGNWRDVLTSHIKSVVGRYAGKIWGWVVVNEAVNPRDGRPDGLRSSNLWVSLAGQGALDLAFQTAHAADPKPYLLYNDYGVERDKPENQRRRDAILRMLDGMLKRKVPVNALGIQAHLEGDPSGFSAPGLKKFLDSVASLGLKIMITELDLGDQNLPGDNNTRDEVGARVYSGFLNTVLQNKNVIAVIQWSFTDKYYWRNDWKPSGGHTQRADGLPDRGLPFDENLRPTPIYNAMLDAFSKAPPR